MPDEPRDIPGFGEFFAISVGSGRTWLICHTLAEAEAAEFSFCGEIKQAFISQEKANDWVQKRWKDLPYHHFPPLADRKIPGTHQFKPRFSKEVQAGRAVDWKARHKANT